MGTLALMRKESPVCLFALGVAFCVFFRAGGNAQEPARLNLELPREYQVFQRTALEGGVMAIAGHLAGPAMAPLLLEGRLTGHGLAGAWKELGVLAGEDVEFRGAMAVPAGGWYRLELRVRNGEATVAEQAVEHVGMGEVFVVAGQSNAANHGEERLTTATGLVSAFDGSRWRLANDPQPGASGAGGSFMPPFGDALAHRFGVPVGVVATAVGATSVREWLPRGTRFPNPPTLTGNVAELSNGEWESKGMLFERFTAVLRQLGEGGFRAVLWHQGESDANQQDATRTLPGALYRKYLGQLIEGARGAAGWDFPWFVAQASYHSPDDAGSADIRDAQRALWESGLALQGPDTDALAGDLRDGGGKGVHFSGAGQRAHGEAWARMVVPWLQSQGHMGTQGPGRVKVFILAGQSNMEGQGVVEMDHPEYYNGGRGNLVWSMEHSSSRERMRHLRDAGGNWVVRDDVEVSFKTSGQVRKGRLTVGFTGYGGSSHIGPELQFGHVLGDFFTEPVLLIKTAWGGKSLHADFRPPGADGETGAYFTQMIMEVREALVALQPREFELAGFAWMQGWNDMISEPAIAEYDTLLVQLVADVRTALMAPNLPVVIGELGNGGRAEEGSGMQAFRAAQRRGAERIARALFVATQDFARPAGLSPNQGHGHHWFGNAESYFLIGDALGHAMVTLLDR